MKRESTQIGESCLNILAPHLTRPFPACAIMEFAPKDNLTDSFEIQKNTLIEYRHNDTICKARTAYHLTIQPLCINQSHLLSDKTNDIALNNQPSLVLEMEFSQNTSIESYQLKPLDIHIDSESPIALEIYQLLSRKLVNIIITNDNNDIIDTLNVDQMEAMGFKKEQQLLPSDNPTPTGYELLSEYIHFPDKFLFFRLDLNLINNKITERKWKIHFQFNSDTELISSKFNKDAIKIHQCPIINLFKQIAEPIH